VVDDEPEVRRTVAALLRTVGHDVTEAGDGATALRLVSLSPPDLVVTDLGMPQMNGWEVARALKRARPGLPVVLLTGWQEAAPTSQAEPSQVDRILGKPVRLEVLQQVIAELTAPAEPEVSSDRPA
jgi:CheY-like chemotaxis protein